MNRTMKLIQNPFTYRIPVIKLAVKKMQSAKFYAILLVLVMLAGILSLSFPIPLLMNDVTASLMNDVPPWSAANVTIGSTGKILTSKVAANSGSPEDIQVAVDAVATAGGGTVYVPEGDFDFDIDPSKTYLGYPVGVLIPGGVSVIGQGKDRTILRQTVNPPTDSRMFYVDGLNGMPVRISGIKFWGHVDLSGYAAPQEGEDDITQRGVYILRATDFRVDHCSFVDFAGTGVVASNYREPYGVNRGVVDHCDFGNPYKDIWAGSWGYGVGVCGSGLWEEWKDIDHYLGKYDGVNDIIYIEDCNFSRTRHAVASNMGGFYVVRHCMFTEPRKVNYAPIDVHGLAGYDGPGGRGLEAYDNEIVGVAGVSPAFWIRGGGGVIYNNSIRDCNEGVGLNKEGDITENWVHDLWIWGNNMNTGTLLVDHDDYTENVNYFLSEKSYTPYPYPHPLTSGSTP